ncbi:hypothetical protein [Halobaculum marinum]|uniref:Uncharacterized protein n=1 Tax=Halobaculum marinum TaxID=3031996 RepID=A0ABD5X3R5_9EURY|nr:hypothetical protein [Halobaculum sp. DT55]
MDCIRCAERVRYDRAVVRESDDHVLGGLCADCERERVGRLLLDGSIETSTDCVFCARTGAVALPMHRIELHDDGGAVEIRGFPVRDDTPRLCVDHAERVLGLDAVVVGHGALAGTPTAVADGGRDECPRGGERND